MVGMGVADDVAVRCRRNVVLCGILGRGRLGVQFPSCVCVWVSHVPDLRPTLTALATKRQAP